MDENNVTRSAQDGLAPDLPAEEPVAQTGDGWNIPRTTVVDIRFKDGGKVYYFDPGDLIIRTGDHAIVETARGVEYGFVANGLHQVPSRDIAAELRPVLRLATEADEKTRRANKNREKEAYRICQQEIERLGLEMQLASAEVAFDGSKILFFFTADGRVDFRELVKSLASAFHTRIELRQIGVRDKAKMIGGLGMCGRPFCCSEFLTEFQPVSIKMAKTQNLSLNPTKISGTCGRLMCCLKYEQEAYEDLIRSCPKNDSFVDTPEGRGTVIDVNLLRQSVKVRMEKQPDVVQSFSTEDIAVWRNGKARKTDPPIPDDWAPISSDPNRRKKEEPIPDFEALLADRASSRQPSGEQAPARGGQSGRRGHRSGGRPSGKGQQSQPAQQEKKDAAPKQQKKQPRQGGQNRQGAQHRPRAEGQQPSEAAPKQQQKKQRPPKQPAPAPAASGADGSASGGEQKKRSNNRRHRHRRSGGGGGNPAQQTPPAGEA